MGKKTTHPKIFRAREKSINFDFLNEKLQKLEDLVEDNNYDGLVLLVKDLVPEWTNKNNI